MEEGSLRIKAKEFATQAEPVERVCNCSTCLNYTRAYLHTLFKENEPLAAQAMTVHNIAYMMRLMRTMRASIMKGEEAYLEFIKDFLLKQYSKLLPIPTWVLDALNVAGVPRELLDEITHRCAASTGQ